MADVTNIALPGAVRLYAAPYVSGSIATPPVAGVAFGDAWGGTWVDLGYTTEDGGSLALAGGEYEIMTAQQKQAVAASGTEESAQISATLLETTLANFNRVKGIGTLTVGSSTTKLGSDGDNPIITYVTIGMECVAPGSVTGATPKYRRVYLWKAKREFNAELQANMKTEQQLASTFVAYRESNAPAGYGKLWALEDQTY